MARIGNIDRFQKALAESGLDAVVAVSPENVPYLSGVLLWSQRAIRDRLAVVVWPRHGAPTFLICNIEEHYVREHSAIEDVRSYVEFKTTPLELVAEVLKEKGLVRGRIGMELGYMTSRHMAEIQRLVPGATIDDAAPVFDKARSVKTAAEIDLLKRAATATERAMLATYLTIRVGEDEHSLFQRLQSNLLLNGANPVAFAYIGAGPSTGFPHADPTGYQVQQGDVVKTDVGGLFDGYCSDVARTGVVGGPTPEQRDLYKRLMEVHRVSIDTLRVGKTAADVFNTAKAEYARVKIPFPLPHQGHSIGLSVHEHPILNPFDHTPLEPGMTFMVETRVRWPGKVGYHVEDLILVTDGAPELLTTRFPTDELFTI